MLYLNLITSIFKFLFRCKKLVARSTKSIARKMAVNDVFMVLDNAGVDITEEFNDKLCRMSSAPVHDGMIIITKKHIYRIMGENASVCDGEDSAIVEDGEIWIYDLH